MYSCPSVTFSDLLSVNLNSLLTELVVDYIDNIFNEKFMIILAAAIY